ncbi:hypothetical protein [Gluconacetobacter tumulicola]|nr:hypothetical protein [Gluconacetobacter tumulicola]
MSTRMAARQKIPAKSLSASGVDALDRQTFHTRGLRDIAGRSGET